MQQCIQLEAVFTNKVRLFVSISNDEGNMAPRGCREEGEASVVEGKIELMRVVFKELWQLIVNTNIQDFFSLLQFIL